MSLKRPNAMQLATTAVKPVRPYNRFGAQKIADTGVDPDAGYKHFLTQDPFKNIDVHRDRCCATIMETSVRVPIGQVPYGTTTRTYALGMTLDAKLDRQKLGIEARNFPRNKTDNLSFEAPSSTRPFQKVFDQVVTKPRFDKNR